MAAKLKKDDYKMINQMQFFTKSYAHDINNVLSVIMGNFECLKMTFPELEKTKEYVALSQGISILQKISNEIGASNTDSPIEVTSILSNLLRFCFCDTKVKQSLLATEDAAKVFIPSSDFYRLFLNILLNARNAMSNEGEILLSVDKTSDKKYVTFAISNTVQNASATLCKQMMQKAVECIDKNIKGKHGIGLKIAYQIVSKYKGRMAIYHDPDLGVIVLIYLPSIEG